MDRKFIIVSGYFNPPNTGLEWFFPIWWENTIRNGVDPSLIYIIASGSHRVPNAPTNWISVNGDVGHCSHLMAGLKPYPFCANTIAVCAGALLAYLSESDLIYKEQDLLAFGPWIDQMYEEIGDKKFIFGSQSGMESANSLFLMKREFTLEFVKWYLGTDPENSPSAVAEAKFSNFQKQNPNDVCRYSFGYDRQRPYNTNDRVWYAQKFSGEELSQLMQLGLIGSQDIPKNHGKFSNV